MADDDARDRTWLSEQPLARALVDSARADEAPEELGSRLAARLCAGPSSVTGASFARTPRSELGPARALPALEAAPAAGDRRRWLRGAAWAAAAAVAIGVGVSQRGGRGELQPESISARTPRRKPALAPVPAPAELPTPCEAPVRVDPSQALIDDFEDGNSRLFAHAGRSGVWRLVTAGEPADATERVLPELLGPGTKGRAMRVAVPAVGGWGASLVASFGRCQDARLFQGIRFKAKGPAVLHVMVNMAEVVDRRHGGTCADDCYHAHALQVVTNERFATYTVRFDELEQPSDTPPERRLPFRPESLLGIAFGVGPGAAPNEFWLDDVELVAMEQ